MYRYTGRVSAMASTPYPRGKPEWMIMLGWAAYLGMSWTWCIGMFLPVLLIRDFGVWGFFVFAIPNVVGAAAMGWIIRSRTQSRWIVRKHELACAAFSAITLVFQLVFFILMMPRNPLAPVAQLSGWLLVLAAVIGLVLTMRPRIGACVLWGVSLALLLVGMQRDVVNVEDPVLAGGVSLDLMLLAPVCVFGFLLCPYLDLTFHKARQMFARRPAVWVFVLGFGVLFASMILGTLGYAGYALRALRGSPAAGGSVIGWHIAIQLWFTIMLHALAIMRRKPSVRRRTANIVVVAAVGTGIALGLAGAGVRLHATMPSWEVVYRCFMAFYGLVFPAYVWICMIPTRDGHAGIAGPRGVGKLRVLAVAVLLAAPCFWMGFIEREEWWLVPGLLCVLVARYIPSPARAGEGGGATATPGEGA